MSRPAEAAVEVDQDRAIDVAEALDHFLYPVGEETIGNARLILDVLRDYRNVSGRDAVPVDARIMRSERTIHGALSAFALAERLPPALVDKVYLEFPPPRPPRGVDPLARRREDKARIARTIEGLSPESRLLLGIAVFYKRFIHYQLETVRETIRRLDARMPVYGREVEPRRIGEPGLAEARSASVVRADLDRLGDEIFATIAASETLIDRLSVDFATILAEIDRRDTDLLDALLDEPWALRFAGVHEDVAHLADHLRHVSLMIEARREARRDRRRLRYAVLSVWVAVAVAVANSLLANPAGIIALRDWLGRIAGG